MDAKQRRDFDSELYGYTSLNQAGNDALRDMRDADERVNSEGDHQ